MICTHLCQAPKSVLTGKGVKFPKNITVTDHWTDLIQHGDVDGDKAALIGDGGETLWTPMQLDLTANKVAKAMRRLLGYWTSNNPDGDLVIGFCLHTTENTILMMIAIQKLGGTYLSLSPTYPEQQIVRIVGTVRPLLIITESDPQISSRFDSVRHVCEVAPLHVIVESSNDFEGDPNDPVPLESLIQTHNRAACIVLTAGTTGEPNFVRIGHMAILNRLYWQYKALPYQEKEVACLSSLLVDAESVAEIFAPLLAGVPLYLIPRHVMAKPVTILDRISDVKITRITVTPSCLNGLFNAMQEMGLDAAKGKFSTLKYLVISGDILSVQLGLKCFQYMAPECRLVVFYGATETMSEATWECFEKEEDFKEKTYSTGRPVANVTIYIMDEDRNIVRQGTVGEICISGKCLALGYSCNKDNTERFIMYPPKVKKSSQIKIFRTGDFGKIVSDRLYYEGRIDMTMSIQGQEVELNNIAVAVESTHLCQECAVLCYHRNREDQAAVAFCVLKDKNDKEMVTAALKKVLEDFMIPDVYPITELPYLPSGRLDRQKLLKVYKFRRMESSPEEWLAMFGNRIGERQAAKILFESISHTVGITLRYVMSHYKTYSFWDVGGNSLNALVIVYTCRENGYLISIDDFVLADSLQQIVKAMVESSRHPVSENQILMHISQSAEHKYALVPLTGNQKPEIINLLSKSYFEKGPSSAILGLTKEDYAKYLENVWNIMIKEDMGVVVIEKSSGKIVGSALCMDVNTKHNKMKSSKKLSKAMSYYIELQKACETLVRETTINKEKGKILQIFMLATDTSVESKYNIILVEFLMKGSMQRALFRGYSWALIWSSSPIIRDLCGNVLQYEMIAEIKLNKFVAKDKTKPFRKARDYQTLKAYYRLFT